MARRVDRLPTRIWLQGARNRLPSGSQGSYWAHWGDPPRLSGNGQSARQLSSADRTEEVP